MDIPIDSKRYLQAEAVWVEESDIWFSSMIFNGLYKYNIKKKQTDFICSFPKENRNEWRLHGKALKIDQEIFFLPNRSRYVHVYNIEEQRIYTCDTKINGRINCKNAIYSEDSIYFISESPQITVCQIYVETKQIRTHIVNLNDYKGGICADVVITGKKLYLACVRKNIVIEYNLDSNDYYMYKIPGSSGGFGTIAYDGKFFLLSDSQNILKWNKEAGTVQSFNRFPAGYGMVVKEGDTIVHHMGFTNKYNINEKPFWCSVIIGYHLWLFPFRTNMIVKMNLLNAEMSEISMLGEEEDENSLNMKTRMTHCHYLGGMQEDKFVFSSTKTKKLYVLESDGNINKKSYLFFAKKPANFQLYFRSNISIITENKKENLKDFLSIIMSDNRLEGNNYNMDSIGSRIFDWIRSN